MNVWFLTTAILTIALLGMATIMAISWRRKHHQEPSGDMGGEDELF